MTTELNDNPSDRVVESMAQLTHALMKANRFGIDKYHPGKNVSNRVTIHEEIADVKMYIKMYEKHLDEGGL